MSNLDFILAKKEDKKEAVPTLHLWSPDTGLKEAFWQAPRFNHETDEPVLAEHLAYDPPTVALNHWHDIYVGTFSGAIHKIPAALNKIPKEELEKLNLKESLTKKNRFADIRTYEDRQLIDERHYLLQGSRSIKSLVVADGEVYDGSPAGVYKTKTGELVTHLYASSLYSDGKELYVVPVGGMVTVAGFTARKHRFREDIIGSLVNAHTLEPLMEKLTPFDGSGCAQAKYCIAGDKVYIHHGDYPAERVTVKSFPGGEEISSENVFSSDGFIVQGDEVFEVRRHPLPNMERQGFLHAGSDELPILTASEPWNITSAVSGGKYGVLLTFYNSDTGMTEIVSHKQQDKPLLIEKAKLKFMLPHSQYF